MIGSEIVIMPVVATSLVSLQEKLKVEEPYLPPRNWESLPSQSRRFLPPTTSSASSSSVSVSFQLAFCFSVSVSVSVFYLCCWLDRIP